MPRATPWGALRTEVLGVLIATFKAWIDDRASSMGAAIAFYTLFSVAPLLLIVISLVALVFGEAAARDEIFQQLQQLVGDDNARTAAALLQTVDNPSAGLLGTLVGVATLLVGATTVFAELQSALDHIWRIPGQEAPGGVWNYLRVRLLSLGLILGLGFLLLVSLIISALLAALGRWWAPWWGDLILLASVMNVLLSIGFITVMFAMIYKWMPSTPVSWRHVWLGALITALLFTAGKFLIGQYLGRSAMGSAFGAASSLVLMLLWVYYSAQIFLLGAEFTWVIAMRDRARQQLPA